MLFTARTMLSTLANVLRELSSANWINLEGYIMLVSLSIALEDFRECLIQNFDKIK